MTAVVLAFRARGVIFLLMVMQLSACQSGSAIPTGSKRYEPTPASRSIDTYFSGQRPSRPYEEIGIVTAQYRSGTGFSSPDVTDVLPKLHGKARELGADAVLITKVIDHPLGPPPNPGYMSTPILEVRAIAIRYSAPSPATAPSPSSSTPARTEVSRGTGFAVRADGVFLTAFHVIRDATKITVMCPGHGPETATVSGAARNNDLAILRAPFTGMSHLSLARPRSLKIGDPVFTIGFPATSLLGSEPKFTDGSVSALSGLGGEATVIQTSVSIQPGSSGGPLLTNEGGVVGVITSSAAVAAFLSVTGTLPQNINWAVKSEYAVPLFDQPEPLPSTASRSEAIERALKATCLIEAIR